MKVSLFSTLAVLATAAVAVNASPCKSCASSYTNTNGSLMNPVVAPYTPAGGKGALAKNPKYKAMSDFDYQSLSLALYQEYIELDLFRFALQNFTSEEFESIGLGESEQYLLEFMSDQEVGHARLITNILGAGAPKACTYQYPFSNVTEFVAYSQLLTKWGEAGVYGFLSHLDSRPAATLLTQSITTEARQQLIFRQFQGLFPMPEWFEPGIPQSWAWTLLAPWIKTCPEVNAKMVWQNFPALNITNNPDPMNAFVANLTSVTANLTYPGREVYLSWEAPGKTVGPNNTYTTSSSAGTAQYVAWVSQLNTTYTLLTNISADGLSGMTLQPNGTVFPPESGSINGTTQFTNVSDPVVNGTMFIAITDSNPFVTPFNLSAINPHVVAGPAVYVAG